MCQVSLSPSSAAMLHALCNTIVTTIKHIMLLDTLLATETEKCHMFKTCDKMTSGVKRLVAACLLL